MDWTDEQADKQLGSNTTYPFGDAQIRHNDDFGRHVRLLGNRSVMLKSSESESDINAFLGKYTLEIAAQMRKARGTIRSQIGTGYELVYDNYNALVFGYSPTTSSSKAIVSLAAYPRWITLFFLQGVTLDDPSHLLQGTANQVRSIRLASPDDLNRPEIQRLIEQARQMHQQDFDNAPLIQTVVKSVSAKQRARRPAEERSDN